MQLWICELPKAGLQTSVATMDQPRRRVFAGDQLRRLRTMRGLRQAELAQALDISISYLSQIESGDRPLTEHVLLALSRAFPGEWAEVRADDDVLLVDALVALGDGSVPGEAPSEDAVLRAVKRQPALVRRIVELHAAYARLQEQVRSLDDKLGIGAGAGKPLPWEEARDWFHAQGNYVDRLDRAAEQLADAIGLGRVDPLQAIEERLATRHGVRTERAIESVETRLRSFDPETRVLRVSGAAEPSTILFLLAHQLMRLEVPELIEAVLEESGTAAARELLSVGLANYAAGALLMPYERFRRAAREVRHDIDRLRRIFMVSFEQACHRLSTLQRPGAAGVPFFFCRVDMAGNITKRHSATRLQFAQTGGACPRWIVHEAVALPDRILVQRAETPDGVRYVSMAKGLVKPSGSYDQSPRRYAVALGCEESHAASFVYADDLRRDGSATPIGISCRICSRADCAQRAFPPAGAEIRIDPNDRSIVPYSF